MADATSNEMRDALQSIEASNKQVVELLTLVSRQLMVHLRHLDQEREDTNKAILDELKLISRQLDQMGELVS